MLPFSITTQYYFICLKHPVIRIKEGGEERRKKARGKEKRQKKIKVKERRGEKKEKKRKKRKRGFGNEYK